MMRFVNVGNSYILSFDSDEAIDGLNIIGDIVIVRSVSPIILAYVCRLLEDCRKIEIIQLDNVIKFRIIDMIHSIQSPMVFEVDKCDYNNRLLQLLRSKQVSQ